MTKALRISVYRDANGGDCSINGVTARYTDVIVTGPKLEGSEEVPVDVSMINGVPVLDLVERKLFGWRYVHARPREIPAGTHSMFGGNFVYTCDSRMRAYSEYPIPVHDRVER